MTKKSVYIHIPFCRQKCLYCDFYSIPYSKNTADEYIDILKSQLNNIKEDIYTIYIGGGTPTVLDAGLLSGLFGSLRRILPGAAEFSIEANPESVNAEKLKFFLDNGVNRISIGLQSFDDRKLKRLGRVHNARDAEDAVRIARKTGFKNISIDLIFGVWGESEDSWMKELDKAARLPIQHISCYGLTYEKNTPLFDAVKNKSVKPLEDNAVASMYSYTLDRLPAGGFKHYEVSNFAKIGFECKHNMHYWKNDPYIGIGASAASYIDGVRSKNIPDVSKYMQSFKNGTSLFESSEKLSPLKKAKETAAIKMRTREGIDFRWFREKTGFDFMELEKNAIAGLIRDGLIKYNREKNNITGIAMRKKGFLFSDTVSSALL